MNEFNIKDFCVITLFSYDDGSGTMEGIRTKDIENIDNDSIEKYIEQNLTEIPPEYWDAFAQVLLSEYGGWSTADISFFNKSGNTLITLIKDSVFDERNNLNGRNK